MEGKHLCGMEKNWNEYIAKGFKFQTLSCQDLCDCTRALKVYWQVIFENDKADGKCLVLYWEELYQIVFFICIYIFKVKQTFHVILLHNP